MSAEGKWLTDSESLDALNAVQAVLNEHGLKLGCSRMMALLLNLTVDLALRHDYDKLEVQKLLVNVWDAFERAEKAN